VKIGVGYSGLLYEDVIADRDGGKPAGNPCGIQMGIVSDCDGRIRAVGIQGDILGMITTNSGDGAISADMYFPLGKIRDGYNIMR
jgi:hypothetical protein